MTAIARWLEDRLQVASLFEATAGHKVPPSTNSWFYVFGSATLLCFVIQIVTGVCLAFVYVPSTEHAWTTLVYLNHQQTLGWFIRAVHNWASNFMVGLMTLHMAQTFLFGAFKFPRELTWVSGVVLLLCTLAMAFTGQVLRFDQDAYWGLGIGASIMGRVPVVGAQLVHLLLAGPMIAGETLSRFFTLHVFVVPGAILGIVSLHLRLVLTKGISEYPTAGKVVSKDRYEAEYARLIHETGVAFAPHAIGKDMIFAGLITITIVGCAVVFGPAGPSGPPDPTLIRTAPKPDFYFLSVFAVLALLPAYMETFLLLTAPVVAIALLVLLPFIAGTGEKSPRRRPIAVLTVLMTLLTLSVLAWLGVSSAWSPVMDAWSGSPVPVQYLEHRTPLERRGAALIQSKQCRNCHALAGSGGLRGPALDGVARRLNGDQLIRQVIQGGGNMPAYGKNLKPAEVTALVAFMETLK